MKHLNFSIIILSVLLLASCTKSEVASSENTVKASIYASFDQGNKSIVDSDGKTAWEAGDKIKVYDANRVECGTGWVAESNGEVVKFTGEMGAEQVPAYAVYPYDAAVDCLTENRVRIHIPEKQDGSFNNAIAVATISGVGEKTATFKNVTTVLKLKLREEDTDVDSLLICSSVNLSGTYRISLTNLNSQSGEAIFNKITLVPKPEEDKIAAGEDLYVCVKAETTTDDAPELTISFLREGGQINIKTKVLGSKFAMNTIKNLGEIAPEVIVTPVPYIEKNGTLNSRAYIDTGITPAVGDDFSSEMEVVFLNTNKGFFFGSRPKYEAGTGCCLALAEDKLRFDYSSGATKYTTPNNVTTGTRYKLTTEKNKCQVYYADGTLYTEFMAGASVHSLNVKSDEFYYPMALGVTRTEPQTQTGSTDTYVSAALPQLRFYYFKLWKNDVLVCDYIPMKDSNGEGGMFDKVTGKFLKSVTSDKFTYGEE